MKAPASQCDDRSSSDCCHYCGLPLAELRRHADDEPQEPRYCCFGCRFAEAITQEKGEAGHVRWTMTRLGIAVFLSMNVMVFTLALWSQDVYSDAGSGTFALSYHGLLRWASLLFTGPVLLMLGGPLLESVLADWRRRSAATDLLLLVGVAASFGYSFISTIAGNGPVYYEVTCMVLVAVTLGRWFEATGKLKTTEALRALESLLPDRVRAIRGPIEVETPLADIRPGDMLRVLAGERIPVDGVVIANSASVDQQAVTGESEPVVKQAGDDVFSGTLNLDGDLRIEAREAGGEGTIRRMIDAVAAAATKSERHQRLADQVSAWFLPAVLVLATVAFAAHLATDDLSAALLAFLAVTLIACPCALGLATPMALWVALGRMSRSQLLFRDGDSLTRLATIKVVCFDKTGTLTTGKAVVDRLLSAEGERDVALAAAAALASGSNHALSQAIAEFASRSCDRERVIEIVDEPRTHPGRGVSGKVAGIDDAVILGNERFLREQGEWSDSLPCGSTETTAFVAWGGQTRGIFVFREQIRPEVASVLETCRKHGLHVEVLTGDHPARGERLQRELGVPVRAGLLPDEKRHAIEQLRGQFGPVLMVGDGINDAPALAAADVGAAMGCGTDISRYSADLCLLGNDLSRIPGMIDLAKETVHVIRWNLVWAFSYNTVGIFVAAAGWLNPIIAAAAMVASSLLVISNALRIGRSGDFDVAMPCVEPAFPASDSSAANVAANELQVSAP